MTLYVDTSALLKRYIDEPDSDRAGEILSTDPVLVTGWHTHVEVRRNLARLLADEALDEARAQFEDDLDALALVTVDEETCRSAAAVAEVSGLRTLDALHLGAAQRAGGTAVAFVTFDLAQAQAARLLGYTVLGA